MIYVLLFFSLLGGCIGWSLKSAHIEFLENRAEERNWR